MPAGGAHTPRARGSTGSGVIVRCAKLTKVFRDFWLRHRVRAVDEIDLDLRRGQVLGLLGPNGSGKSTTIKLILGLLYPTSGGVAVFGKQPEHVQTKHLIGYLPEESYLYAFLNARETLDYYGRLFHQNRRQRQRRIGMLLEMVGLDAVQHRPVGQYSKGMQRRIGLAQALINDPQLLILDEPTNGMDPLGTRQIKDLIHELSRRGKTILLCSHLLADVEDVCDRVAIMFGGKIRAAGTVDDLLVCQDVTTIQTPALDAELIDKIETILQAHDKHIQKVEHPRQKLESRFVDIIREAQAEGAPTSGAGAGGDIARFLVETGSHEPTPIGAAESVRRASVIDRLVNPEPQTPSAPMTAGDPVVPQTTDDRPDPSESPVLPPAAQDPTQPDDDTSVIEDLVMEQWSGSEDLSWAGPAVDASTAPLASSDEHPSDSRSEDPAVAGANLTGSSRTPEEDDHEEPDQAFLDALEDVPPFDPGKTGP